MAKYDEGDEVRLTRNIEFGSIQVKKTTIGEIKKIKKKSFGKNEYTIKFRGCSVELILHGERDFVEMNYSSF